MSNIEELEQKKRELELRRDIARLERNERLAEKASSVTDSTKKRVAGWGLFSVSICTLVGGFLVLVGFGEGTFIPVFIGAVFLIPLFVKLSQQWQS